ncbi:MAG: aldo/keto reductase, partial [Bradyrhizobium sp.]
MPGPERLVQRDRGESIATLHAALDAGITLIDTAAAYDDAEAVIGRAIGHRRDE